MLIGTNRLILDNLEAIRRRHFTYRGGFNPTKSNHWIDVARSELEARRGAHRHDAFALIVAATRGGPNDSYVIPFARLASIFARTAPNKSARVWRAHVVDGRFYFAAPDEVPVRDCHGSQAMPRRVVEATLFGTEAEVCRALADLCAAKEGAL